MFRRAIPDKESLFKALQEVSDQEPPFTLILQPLRTNKHERLYRRFHAQLDQIAEVKGMDSRQREELKKDFKVHFGKFEVRHDHVSGQKAYTIYSINDYSEADLKNLVNEVDVWSAENGIYNEQ